MRVLAIQPGPHFSVSDVHRGWVDGLRQSGAEVIDCNLSDRLNFFERARFQLPDGTHRPAVDKPDAVRLAVKTIEQDLYEWWPDVVLVTSGFFLPAALYQLMRSRGHRVVLLCTESPYEDERQLEFAPHADVVLLNDPTNIDRFRAANPATYYMPHSYDPTRHAPDGRKVASEFAFVGTGYPSRVRFLEQCDLSGVDVLLAGNWMRAAGTSLEPYVGHDLTECVDNDETAAIYRGTQVSTNLYRLEANPGDTADGWAIGPREVELAACGTFFLRDSRPESDLLFPSLPTFDGPDDFSRKLRWWLDHPDARAEAAAEARAAIVDRTFANHAAQLLDHLDTRKKAA